MLTGTYNEGFEATADDGLRSQDLHEWQSYEMALSPNEHRLRNEAMRNFRMTNRFIADCADSYDPEALSKVGMSHHLRMATLIASKVEHYSFETWREVRRIRRILNLALTFWFITTAMLSLSVLYMMLTN
ncbi:hypothetical protein MWN63_02780 [Paradonghicola geojensis]|nr:hypothetical protein [Marivivens geojensis]